MAMTYAIGVENKYMFIADEDDGSPIKPIKRKEEATHKAPARTEKAEKTNTSGNKTAQKKDAAPKKAAAPQTTPATNTGTSRTPNVGSENKKDATAPAKTKQMQSSNRDTNVSKQQTAGSKKEVVPPQNSVIQKKGDNRSQNRAPRQEKVEKPKSERNSGNFEKDPWAETGTWDDMKDQKDIDEKKNRKNREDRQPFYQNSDFNRDRRGEDAGKLPSVRGRGGFRGRGGRGGGRGGFDFRGKREYDRQSGSDKTGIKSSEKRDGSGAHNWGNLNDDYLGQTDPLPDDPEKPVDDVFNNDTKENNATDNGKEVNGTNEEETVKQMTYDEWVKLGKRTKHVYNLRKPGEGTDPSQWKQTYVLRGPEKQEVQQQPQQQHQQQQQQQVHVESESAEPGESKPVRQKRILDIEINFVNDISRRGRGRGARGPRNLGGDRRTDRNRGGGPHTFGDRGDRQRNRPFRGRDSKEQSSLRVDVNNFKDFPSLATA